MAEKKKNRDADAPREPYKFIPVETPEDIQEEIRAARIRKNGQTFVADGSAVSGEGRKKTAASDGSQTTGQKNDVQTTPRFESMADIMKEFHRGTEWELNNGEMAALAIEDTHAKITNYYVIHDRAWTHGAVVDFIDMDEGTGRYTVYALCTDGTVLAVPEEDLDEPVTVTYGDQRIQMVRHLPKEIENTAELGRRILAEKDRTMAEYEKQKAQMKQQ